MLYEVITDYHVHTDFSDDSVYPMEDVIKKAISLCIQELCFTEHRITSYNVCYTKLLRWVG